jgi:hypothetical protein
MLSGSRSLGFVLFMSSNQCVRRLHTVPLFLEPTLLRWYLLLPKIDSALAKPALPQELISSPDVSSFCSLKRGRCSLRGSDFIGCQNSRFRGCYLVSALIAQRLLIYHKLLKTTSTMLLFSLSIHVCGILVKTDHDDHTHHSSYLSLLQLNLLGCEICLVLRGWL